MLVANFIRFRRKRLEKQIHIDNFFCKKIQNEFIWLRCTFYTYTYTDTYLLYFLSTLLKKCQKTRKTENN